MDSWTAAIWQHERTHYDQSLVAFRKTDYDLYRLIEGIVATNADDVRRQVQAQYVFAHGEIIRAGNTPEPPKHWEYVYYRLLDNNTLQPSGRMGFAIFDGRDL